MGNEEIQTIHQMSNTSSVLVGATVPEVQTSVSTLAVVELVFGWNNGSPVSREVHAGFCEKLRVRFPRLTQLRSHNSYEEEEIEGLTDMLFNHVYRAFQSCRRRFMGVRLSRLEYL